MSVAVQRPPGAMSATIGVRSAIRPNSSMSSGNPNSWAIASRCSTPLVEPPVAATEAMALSIAGRVTKADGRMSSRTSPITSSPQRRAASSLAGSSAGMPLRPAEGHGRGRDGLVAADEADDAIEQMAPHDELDRIGDDLAAHERGLHPFRPHRDAVRDGNRVELHRRAAGGPNTLLHLLGQPSLVQVAGHRLDPGGRDADQRLGEVLVREP